MIAEDAGDRTGILADIACGCEQEAQRASGNATRVVVVRTGIVLDPREDALATPVMPFQSFAGGPFESARQYLSWIHPDHGVSLATWLAETPDLEAARRQRLEGSR